MKDKLARMDIGIFFATIALLGFGIVIVYSSSFAVAQDRFGGADFFLERQLVRAALGVLCLFIFVNIDYHVWGKLSWVGFVAALVMLAFVLMLPDSQAINGAKRWVTLGGVRFQVSEFARIALIIFLAQRLQEQGESIGEWKVFMHNTLKIGLICGLIVVEPDFSTALLIGGLGVTILFVAGAKFLHIISLFLFCVPWIGFGLLGTSYRRERFFDYLNRLFSFLNLNNEVEGIGYQATQALVGLGNGGIFGVGLGRGRQKFFFLPEPHTDFAFSILGEEIGFVGLAVIFLVFGFIVYRGFRIAKAAPDKSGQIMAFGITLAFCFYILMHTGVNVGLIPTTGVPLPFLSYGGMSLIFTMCSIGILLNISSQATNPSPAIARVRKERLNKFRPAMQS